MAGNGHIFISYRSLERDFAARLAADLRNTGVSVWIDVLDIPKGGDWRRAVQQAVDDCIAMIPVLSPDYVRSNYCRKELARAERMKRPIVPVMLRPVDGADWPIELEGAQYISFQDWQDTTVYRSCLLELVNALQTDAGIQIGPPPDVEHQYLTSLIADLESRRGVLEYVELSAEADQPERPAPRASDAGWAQEFALLVDPTTTQLARAVADRRSTSTSEFARLNRIPLDSIREAVETHPRFVLIGEPGAGKTTTLRWLALEAAEARFHDPRAVPLPLLLYLPQWGDEAAPLDFIRTAWPFDGESLAGALASGDAMLYLDGLNEMGAAGVERARLLRRWLASDSAPARLIITCRAGEYTEDLNLGLPVVLASEMDEPRIRQFAANYLGKQAAMTFMMRILEGYIWHRQDAYYLLRLARNPYLLAALIYIYKNSPEGDLPRNAGLLFRRLAVTLWDRERSRQIPGWIPFADMEAALGRLAFAMIDDEMPIDVPHAYALRHVGDPLLLRAAASANLLEINENTVRFYHQLMQEYFAAAGLFQVGLTTRLTPPRFELFLGRIAGRWDKTIAALCGVAPDVDSIIHQINASDPYLASECLMSGVQVQPGTRADVVVRLVEALDDRRWSVRKTAAETLGRLKAAGAVPRLVSTLHDNDEEVRAAAAWALGQVGAPAVPGLVAALRESESGVRWSSAEALGTIGVAAVPGLTAALRHEDKEVREASVKALAEIRSLASVPGLVEALTSDTAWDVREAAARALGTIKAGAAVPGLINAFLADADERVRGAAAGALGDIGSPAAAPLVDLLRDPANPLRVNIAGILGVIRDSVAVPGLSEAMADPDAHLRAAAAWALGQIRDGAAVPTLAGALDDINKSVRDAALEALRRIRTPEARAALQAWNSKD